MKEYRIDNKEYIIIEECDYEPYIENIDYRTDDIQEIENYINYMNEFQEFYEHYEDNF